MTKFTPLSIGLTELVLLSLRIAWHLFCGLARQIDALTEAMAGQQRRLGDQRRTMEERPPLSDLAFVEQADIAPGHDHYINFDSPNNREKIKSVLHGREAIHHY
jgi:hypothetical protein